MNSRKESWFSKHNMINVQKLQHSLSKSNSMFLKINYKILHPVFVVEQQYPCIQKSFLMPEQNFDGLCFNMRQNFLIYPDILEDFYIYFIYIWTWFDINGLSAWVAGGPLFIVVWLSWQEILKVWTFCDNTAHLPWNIDNPTAAGRVSRTNPPIQLG